MVAWLGMLDEARRLGVKQAASVWKTCGSLAVYGWPCIWALHLGPASDSDAETRFLFGEGDSGKPRACSVGCEFAESDHRAIAGTFQRTVYRRAMVSAMA